MAYDRDLYTNKWAHTPSINDLLCLVTVKKKRLHHENIIEVIWSWNKGQAKWNIADWQLLIKK